MFPSLIPTPSTKEKAIIYSLTILIFKLYKSKLHNSTLIIFLKGSAFSPSGLGAYLCKMISQKNIRTLSFEELTEYFATINEKKFRAKQVWEWLWQKHATSFEDMTNLSKELRQHLS